MRFKYKWLSENDGNAGGGASGTPTQQTNSGDSGQGQQDPRIKQLTDEAFNHRQKKVAAEQERDSWKQKFEDVTGQLTTAQAQAQLKLDVILAAARQGFSDPEDALRFIDLTKLDTTDDKRAQAITDALKALGEGKPYLVKQPATPAAQTQTPPPKPSAGNPAGQGGLTMQQIEAMSDEDFAKHKDDILKYAATHRG